jgi:gluconate 5-dehydrogenase
VAAIRDGIDGVATRWGGIDILVNCVGLQREQPLLEVTEEAYDEVIAVNLKAAMFQAQAVARHQVAAAASGRHGARQVHLLSVRARLGLRGRGYSAYCSSKGGLAMLIRQHALELAPHGITVNGVAPTVVRTEMARHWLDNPVTRAQIIERIPLGRVAEPRDVVGAVMFFSSPASEFVTGQVLYVDGGITASQ